MAKNNLNIIIQGEYRHDKADKQIKEWQNNLSNKPWDIKATLRLEDRDKLISGERSRFKEIAEQMLPQAKTIDKIRVFRSVVNQMSDDGKKVEATYQKVTKAIVTFSTASGEQYTKKLDLLNANEKATRKEAENFDINYSKQSKAIARSLNLQDKEMATKINNGFKWLETSKNISSKEVEIARTQYKEMNRAYYGWRKASKEGRLEDTVDPNGNIVKGANTLKRNFETASKSLDKVESGLRRGSGSLRTWSEAFANAMKQTVAYTFSIGLIQNLNSEIQKGIKYIFDLSAEMTKIRVLGIQGANTTEEIKSLAEGFNRLAQEMGVSTLEVAKGSVEWLRQGKTIAETNKLLESTIMLSKLGNIDAAQATEYLTAITNAYKISAEETVGVVDKLIAVDNISATSSSELATALRYTSVSGKEAGVTFEKLVSYIAAVSSVTRGSAESIGQAFKTIFARMQDLKAGIDVEEGGTISKVEGSLKKVGIALRDSKFEFRDMSDVLEEVAGKWSTLTEMEQTEIAKNIAGIRQRETFFVLMENMGKAQEYQTAQLTSSGLAAERYGTLLEDVNIKAARVQSTLEGLWQKSIDSNAVKIVLDITNAFLGWTSAIGGLVPIMFTLFNLMLAIGNDTMRRNFLALGTTFKQINREIRNSNSTWGEWIQKLLLSPFTGIKDTFTDMMDSIKNITNAKWRETAGPTSVGLALEEIVQGVGLVSAGIGVAVMAWQWYQQAATDALNESRRVIEENKTAISNLIKAQETMVPSLVELANNTNRTTEEGIRFKQLQNELKDLIPTLEGTYDSLGNFMLDAAGDASILNQKLFEQIDYYQRVNALRAIYGTNVVQDTMFDTDVEAKAHALSEQGVTVGADKKAVEKARQNLAESTKKITDWTIKLNDKSTTAIEKARYKNWIDSEKIKNQQFNDELMAAEGRAAISEADAKVMLDELYKMYLETPDEYKEAFLEKMKGRMGTIQYEKTFLPYFNEQRTKEYIDAQAAAAAKSMGDAQGKIVRGAYLGIVDELANLTERKGLIDSLFGLNNIDATQMQDVIKLAAKYGLEDYSELLTIVNGRTVMNKQAVLELELAYQSQTKTLAENAGELDYNKEVLDSYFSKTQKIMAGIKGISAYGQTITTQTMMLAGEDIAQAAWAATEGTKIRFKDLQGNLLNSQDALQTAMTSSFGNFISILSQIQNAGIQTSGQIGTIIAGWNKFILTGLKPGAANFTSTGGGGGSGETPEQIAAKEEIKNLNKQKEALQKRLAEYQKYIDLKKQELKLQKEEKDFLDKLASKNKSLARMRSDILMLSLDDSEEARSKQLSLEDDAAKLEEEITKDKEDRKYEIQVQALDDLARKFEESINKQIDRLDEQITKIEEVTQATNSAGGAVGDLGDTYNDLGSISDIVLGIMIDNADALMGKTDDQIHKVGDLITQWYSLGVTIDGINERVAAYNALVNKESLIGFYQETGMSLNEFYNPTEEDHEGGFAGGLESNEVYAKLLKGEYVATEGQMRNFINNSLPQMAKVVGGGNGGINISMPINVSGNLDSTVIPDIQKIADSMLKKINSAMKERGNIRQTTLTSI